MGVRSYLTVGLLFGLTLPGVSAHGFLVGRGEEEEAGQQGYTPSQKNHFSRPQREREDGAKETRREEGGATDPAEDRTEETQTDKDERRRSSVGYADPDSGYSLAG